MKRTYNPNRAPGPWWNDLDESSRQHMVERYHRKKRIELPNATLHALFHVIVENQAQLGDETPVAEAIDRLQSEGLTRHDAVHAVGSRLAGLIFAAQKGEVLDELSVENYYDGIRALTMEAWLSEMEEEEP